MSPAAADSGGASLSPSAAGDGDGAPPAVLRLEGLATAFDTENGLLRAVDGVSFALNTGETLGVVGESGCGKSVTALSVMRLLPRPSGRIVGGRILFDGTDLVRLPPEGMRRIRGKRIAMIFQEPMTALNPVHTIGRQLGEVFRLHFEGMADRAVREESLALLARIGIPDPGARLSEYPHQISGGMRQRVMIAMAMAGRPDVLIADEPTTALDVTIQAQILDELRSLQERNRMAMLFITHDLGVIAEICETVVVMYAGRVVEIAPAVPLFRQPAHPYTMGLLASMPRLTHAPKTRLPVIRGMVPGLLDLPEGCRFRNRCPYSMPICGIASPPLKPVAENHATECWLYP